VVDVVLSSGFLAFPAHCGFLAGLEDEGVPVDAGCGTSSGALVLSLWAAGVPAREILTRTTTRAPLASCTLHAAPWRGLFRLEGVMRELGGWLPAHFGGLRFPLWVGVVRRGEHALLSEGLLVPAVAASCAVPWLFEPVEIDAVRHEDGAKRDRFGLTAFRRARGARPTVVHAVDRSGGHDGEVDLSGVVAVHSPRSGASLWRRPAAPEQAFERTRRATREALAAGLVSPPGTGAAR
jgi:predicted acylesterase/phospholipase RssA